MCEEAEDPTRVRPDESGMLFVDDLRNLLKSVASEVDAHANGLESFIDERLNTIEETVSSLQTQINRMERRSFRLPSLLLTEHQALQQLMTRYSPEVTLPPVAGWALNPTGILCMTDLIDASARGQIIECGSGTSTLWAAYAIRKKGGGRVIALEHDPDYAKRTREMIRDHGLTDYAEIRSVPLKSTMTPRGEFQWYDIDDERFDAPIDVLLVDGPPGTTGTGARYPAFPLLKEWLSSNAYIIVDDTNREDEREVVRQWLREEPRLKRRAAPGEAMELLLLTS